MTIVKVYSTPTCPWCFKVKDFLKEHKITFEDIDVTRDHDAARHMVEKTGQMGVPVIEIGEQFVIGFDRDKLIRILKIKD